MRALLPTLRFLAHVAEHIGAIACFEALKHSVVHFAKIYGPSPDLWPLWAWAVLLVTAFILGVIAHRIVGTWARVLRRQRDVAAQPNHQPVRKERNVPAVATVLSIGTAAIVLVLAYWLRKGPPGA
jgi:hypothetical protein